MNNLFADLPADTSQEQIDELFSGSAFRVERIVSQGNVSPPGFWYDQPQVEWVVVLSGAAKLLFEDEDEAVELRPGDHVVIAAHRKHRVEWTSPDQPTVWLAIHFEADG